MDRVFQECVTYSGEMDYKSYLDFVLALENRSEPQSLQYLFRILDIDHKGYLNPFDLNFFFRAIQRQLKRYNHDPVNLRDIQDEIYDMIKPQGDPCKIRLADLIASGHGETVVNILIDLNSFWTHENRESLAGGEPPTATAPSPPQSARVAASLNLDIAANNSQQSGKMTSLTSVSASAKDEDSDESSSNTSSPR